MPDDNDEKPVHYHIDTQGEEDTRRRAIKHMIVSRMGYTNQQSFTADVIEDMEAEDMIQHVAYQEADTADFLLPDTPLKEAIFRVLLANENKPMTPEQISKTLEDKWPITPYPRDLSPAVIERLLENSGDTYCIAQTLPDEEAPQDPDAASQDGESEETPG